MIKILTLAAISIFLVIIGPLWVMGAGIWGRLANPGYENQPVKSAYFFTGNWKNGVQYYEYFPGDNTGLYTIHPADARHLGWSENEANREFAVNTMISAGVNVINMSCWGPRGQDNWAWWAPMQTSSWSHDELFEAALDKNILIVPYLETAAATPNSPEYSFMNCFPGEPGNPAPAFVAIMEDLMDRYLLDQFNAPWPEKWAQMYDRNGQKRYVFSLIHVASTQSGVTDELFAEGFDHLADKIYQDTGVLVGFTLDIVPHLFPVSGQFHANPFTTGPLLAQQESILAIQCFIPEIGLGMNDDDYILNWKQQFSSAWIHTGIPFIQDIAPGYDAHIVFPNSVNYGNNTNWRNSMQQIVDKLPAQGITFNAWNGYTEGYAGVPTLEYGDSTYNWASSLYHNYQVGSLHYLPGRIEAEDWVDMFGVLTEANTDGCDGLDVGWLDGGDWLDYNIETPEQGKYYVELRIAKNTSEPQGEGQLQISDNILASFNVPGTGGWQNWRTIHTTAILPAGEQTLRLAVTGGGWNINWLDFNRDSVEYYHAIPGRIEAEDYADMYGVKTDNSLEKDSEVSVGQFDDNDWLDYDVEVQQEGSYDVLLRVALDNSFAGGGGELYADDDFLCSFNVPGSGGWKTWQTINTQVNLSASRHKLRLLVSKGPWNLNWLEFVKKSVSVEHPAVTSNTPPKAYRLYANYPNPFNPATRIHFDLPQAGDVSLKVYDIQGRQVANLADGYYPAGEYRVNWNPQALGSGVYYYRLVTAGYAAVGKAVLVK